MKKENFTTPWQSNQSENITVEGTCSCWPPCKPGFSVSIWRTFKIIDPVSLNRRFDENRRRRDAARGQLNIENGDGEAPENEVSAIQDERQNERDGNAPTEASHEEDGNASTAATVHTEASSEEDGKAPTEASYEVVSGGAGALQ